MTNQSKSFFWAGWGLTAYFFHLPLTQMMVSDTQYLYLGSWGWWGWWTFMVLTYAVIPAYEGCRALFDVVGGDFEGVVHGGQAIRLHRPFAPKGTLTTVGKVASIGDLRRMAQVIFTTSTTDAETRATVELVRSASRPSPGGPMT